MTTTRTKRLRIKRITPTDGFTLRQLRQLRRLYKQVHEHPITAAQLRALPDIFEMEDKP